LGGSPARFIERPSLRGYLGQLYAIAGWTSLPWLHRLRPPTLVLAGDDDPIVPLLNARMLSPRTGEPGGLAPVGRKAPRSRVQRPWSYRTWRVESETESSTGITARRRHDVICVTALDTRYHRN